MSNMVIRTNVLALNSHRSLKTVGVAQEKASNRLSTGYRINSAADDAAGLAISEKMRAQIRGLDMASKNTQDATSLIQTAEGGMQEIDNMLQRIRELLVQASNDTNDQTIENAEQGDRQKIQDEIGQLIEEVDSMADRVEFNNKKIIDGTYADMKTVLAEATKKLDAAKEAQAKTTDGITESTGFETANTTDVDNLKAIIDSLETAKGGSAATAGDPAQAKTDLADAINTNFVTTLVDGTTGTKGDVETSADWESAVKGLTLTGFDAILDDDTKTDADIKTAIEGILNDIKLDADGLINGAGNVIVNPDGTDAKATLNYTVAVTDGVVTITGDYGADFLETTKDAFNADLAKIEDAFNAAIETARGTPAEDFDFDEWKTDNSDLLNITPEYKENDFAFLTETEEEFETGLNAAYDKAVKNGKDLASEISNLKDKQAMEKFDVTRYTDQKAGAEKLVDSKPLYFQVGANAQQKLELNISSVKSDILGLGDGEGTTHINVIKSSGSEITDYITALDESLTMVTTERSKLGAAQNRLEYTMNSLDVSSENITAAESRIRDTDMAKEMMNFTQANVLQQAATSMLAQANQSKQSILQLLQ